MRLRFIIAGFVTAGLLMACGGPTAYQATDDGYGYTEAKLESDHYRVEFRGNSLTDRKVVESYLLYRAAELTLETGNDYFVVVEQDIDKKTTYHSSSDYPFGGRFPYHYYPYSWYHPQHTSHETVRSSERFTAVAEIYVGKGAKPTDNPSAYDARSVIDHLEGSIQRPEISE